VAGRDLPKNGAQTVDLPRVKVGEEFGVQLGRGLQGLAGKQAAAGRELEVLAAPVAGVTHALYRVEFFQIVGHVNDDARGNPQGTGEVQLGQRAGLEQIEHADLPGSHPEGAQFVGESAVCEVPEPDQGERHVVIP
jgi:hypothetical protein